MEPVALGFYASVESEHPLGALVSAELLGHKRLHPDGDSWVYVLDGVLRFLERSTPVDYTFEDICFRVDTDGRVVATARETFWDVSHTVNYTWLDLQVLLNYVYEWTPQEAPSRQATEDDCVRADTYDIHTDTAELLCKWGDDDDTDDSDYSD